WSQWTVLASPDTFLGSPGWGDRWEGLATKKAMMGRRSGQTGPRPAARNAARAGHLAKPPAALGVLVRWALGPRTLDCGGACMRTLTVPVTIGLLSLTALVRGGDLETKTLRSEALGAEMKINVLLPDGYASGGEHRYPVVYLLHGI